MSNETLTNWIKFREKYSFNTIIVVIGDNRMGKTMLALGLCEQWDKNFNIDQVLFDFHKFLDFVENGKPCWLLFDEVGVTFSSSEWWSVENRIFGHVSESFGKLGINLILTLPSTNMLSRQGLAMTHFFIKMLRRGVARVYLNLKEPLKGKNYPKRIGHIQIGMPSKELELQYEEKKRIFLKDKAIEWKEMYQAYRLKNTMQTQRILNMNKTNEDTNVIPDSQYVDSVVSDN